MPRGRKKPATQPGDDRRELLKELWEAAVNLRGSIEPSDYKRYVLPIIFLRFLSLKFELRRKQLSEMILDGSGGYHAQDAAAADDILGDPDEYRSAGAFVIPEAAQWEFLRKSAQQDDVKIVLDNALEALEFAYPDKLRGLLPRIYAGSNLSRENVTGLINLFSRDAFREDHGGSDLIGLVYEYFIGGFADSEGKRGGEYFTPVSIVRTLVAMLEPEHGTVFDPCCGSGGMFVQSDLFTHHGRKLSFYGQESKDFTYRLCRMNLFIHGLDGDIKLGNSYGNDQHASLRADYVLANPPFNDGAKSREGWGANNIPDDDPRLILGNEHLALSPRNANTMWMLHFLHHLKEGGTAGFVMATGELSNSEIARLAVRKALIEGGYVDCIVQLSKQLFANTQIPCALWFLSKNRDGRDGYRERREEILFIDGRKLGLLIPGSRKQKELSDDEISRIAILYQLFKRDRAPEDVPGVCRVARLDDVRNFAYALTPNRYVGSQDPDDDVPFEERFLTLKTRLDLQFSSNASLEKVVRESLATVRLDG